MELNYKVQEVIFDIIRAGSSDEEFKKGYWQLISNDDIVCKEAVLGMIPYSKLKLRKYKFLLTLPEFQFKLMLNEYYLELIDEEKRRSLFN